jgi:drug/metabolite transporter (DMT)-like permease
MANFFPISLATFGAFLEAAGTIIEKKILRKHNLDSKSYTVLEFIAIIIAAIPIFLILNSFFPQIFSWKITPEAFELKNLLIFGLIVVSALFANLFVFYAMKWEKITELEPIRLMQPLFVILFAFTLYSIERSTPTKILVAALIAAIALIFSHLKKHHLQFNKYSMSAIFGSILFALDLALSNFLLPFYSPLSLYFTRSLIVLLICFTFIKVDFRSQKKQTWFYLVIVGFIWVIYRAILYYSYTTGGVIFTTLLFMLTPIFIYLMSYIYLKEKPNWRNVLASIVILICILYATLA